MDERCQLKEAILSPRFNGWQPSRLNGETRDEDQRGFTTAFGPNHKIRRPRIVLESDSDVVNAEGFGIQQGKITTIVLLSSVLSHRLFVDLWCRRSLDPILPLAWSHALFPPHVQVLGTNLHGCSHDIIYNYEL